MIAQLLQFLTFQLKLFFNKVKDFKKLMFKITGRDALPEYTSTNPSAEFKKYDTKDYKEQPLSRRSV